MVVVAKVSVTVGTRTEMEAAVGGCSPLRGGAIIEIVIGSQKGATL